MTENLSTFYQLILFRDQVKEALGLGELSNDATIGEIHNLKTERSYYRSILDHLCDQLGFAADGFERLKDVRIVKTSESENLAIDNRRPCSFSRRVNVLLDDNPDEILTVLGDDQMLARIEKMYDDLTAANEFRDQVKFLFGEGLSDDETIAAIKARRWDQNQSNKFVMAIKEALSQGWLSDDETIAKIEELTEQSQLLSEIVDILNKANTECLDHYRSKQEEKIVLTGFRRLCDIHAALFKKRSDYEIYGSRIINDLLNSVDLQAQKQAYDQEEIKRIDKAERESFDSLRELYFAIAEMLGVNNDKEMIAKIKELAEIKAEIALGNIGVLSNLSYEFRSQIKQALYEGVRKDKYPSIDEFPDDDAISFVEHLIDRHKHWGRDHEFTQFALEVKQLLIDLVGKGISNDEAIAEIKRLQQSTQPIDILEMSVNANEIREKEFDVLLEEVTKLKSDLRIANKVIARLVGE